MNDKSKETVNILDGVLDYMDRVKYAVAKVGADTVQLIPYVGPPTARGVNRFCDEIHWANDHIVQESTTLNPACQAVKDAVAEYQLGQLAAPRPTNADLFSDFGRKSHEVDR